MILEKCKTCKYSTTYENHHNGHPEDYCDKYDDYPSLTPCNIKYTAWQKENKIQQLQKTIAEKQKELHKLEKK